MPTHRLDPSMVPMQAAVAWFLGRAEPGTLDLSGSLVATPGARAGRILITLLAQACQSRGILFTPPRTTTGGGLAEALAPADRPAAEAHRALAWRAVLDRAEPGLIEAVLPGATDAVGWADELRTATDELAHGGLRCADVAHAELPPMEAPERWHALAELQKRYESALASAGLVDPVLHANDTNEVGAGLDKLVLLACTDLGNCARALVRRVGCPVHVLTAIDAGLHDDGVVDEAYWDKATIEIDPARVFVTHGPDAQSTLAVRAAVDLRTSAIGTVDEALAGSIRRAANAYDVDTHVAWGRPLAATGPAELLRDLSWLLRERSFAPMQRVLRCPAVIASLATQDPRLASLPQALDRYLGSALPSRAFRPLPKGADRVRPARSLVRRARRRVVDAIRPLAGRPRRLSDWAGEIERVLVALLEPGQSQLGEDSLAALEAIGGHLRTFAALQPSLDHRDLRGHEALSLLIAQLASQSTSPQPGAEAFDVLGWLELPLDPSPSMVVMGAHDSTLPAARSVSPLIAEGLRRALGLPGEGRALARDAAAMATLVDGGRDVRFVLGTSNTAGDPTLPSTLLMRGAGDGPARVLERVANAFPVPPTEVPPPRCGYRVGVLDTMPTVERMAVTSFKTFIQSPYLFYLRHVLGLDEVDASPEIVRMEPNAFGTIVHEALRSFASDDELRTVTDESQLRQLMKASLWDTVERFAGTSRSATLLAQVDAAERRLDRLAAFESAWRQAGWRTLAMEWRPAELPTLVRSGIALSGSIDRIDWHEGDRKLALLDYKTAEDVRDPCRTHRRRDGSWIDLQLPLYEVLSRPIAIERGLERVPSMGYIAVSASDASVLETNWDESDLADAHECAERIGERVRAGLAELAEIGEPQYESALTRLAGVGLLLDDEHRPEAFTGAAP